MKLWERQAWTRQGVIAVVVSAVLMVWIYTSLEDRPKPVSAPLGHAPDSFMTDFVRTDMNDQGKIKARLEATHMDHFADDQSIELTDPLLHIYEDKPEPWRVRAKRAWVDAEQNVMLMSGQVQAWRDDAQGQIDIRVNTGSAIVFPKTRAVEGSQTVTISLHKAQHSAEGFRVDFVNRRVELLHRVKSRYEIEKHR